MNIAISQQLADAIARYRSAYQITSSNMKMVDELLTSALTKYLNDAELGMDAPFPTPPSLNR